MNGRQVTDDQSAKKDVRKKHCEAVCFMVFGSIRFNSIKKIALVSFPYAFSRS